MSDPAEYRDLWRERMRLEGIKRHERNKIRRPRKIIPDTDRMPWPEPEKVTPETAWRQPRVR